MRKRMQKLLGGALAVSMILGMCVSENVRVQAEESSVSTADLSDKGTAEPEPWGVVPSPNQYRYQKDELAAFCHFGPNTYSGYEWGFDQGSQTWLYEGRTPAQIFPLSEDFDAETLVTTLKEAGFKKLIVTAKHHDGFCIWNSEYTDYDVASSNYKEGKGDVLAEISAACTKYDMDMGLYLSPWDVAEPSYGYFDSEGNSLCDWNGTGTGIPKNEMTWEEMEERDAKDYNEYYDNQLREILSSPKYGNDGHFVEVWMDGAKGDRSKYQEYDFVRWFQTIQKYEGKEAGFDDDCLLFGAQAYTTVRWIGNEDGLANEETWAQVTVDKDANDKGGTINSYSTSNGGKNYTMGSPTGNQWTVPEADARITSGWFWGDNKKMPKSLEELSNMYFNSVGHNATLLLNVPPNPEGKVDQAILERIREFGSNIKESFADNLAEDAVITASEVRGNDSAFSPENVLDQDDATYWTMDDSATTGSITLDLGKTKVFDLVTIEEAIQLGQRISGFKVEYRDQEENPWQLFGEGTTIGAKRICKNKKVRARFVKISITGSKAVPLISEVGIYKATEAFEEGSGIPEGLEIISVTDRDTSDGAGFTYETGDWTLESGSGFVEENSMYAGSGKEATLNFVGSKIWLYGTKDSGHGTADIYIDGEKKTTIDTRSNVRATGQMIFESEDLQHGSHTLRIVNKGTIGLDAAAALNNDGKGMLQFIRTSCETEEDSETEVVVKRVGGSAGRITAVYTNNPGSAVQGHYDVDGIRGTLTFENGETEKTFKVRTTRYKGETGDLSFTVDLESAGGGAILGFYTSMSFMIRDLDDPERLEEAKQILSDSQNLDFGLYTGEGQSEVQKLTAQLNAYINAGERIELEDVIKTAIQLRDAKSKLTVRESYTIEDPFVFPVGEKVKTLEAECFQLDASNAANAERYVRITTNEGASNGKEVNWFENGNRIVLPFTAEKAGRYKVTATYRSGKPADSNPNAFEWSGQNIVSGSQDVYGNGSADAEVAKFRTTEFTIEVTQAGAGELVFTASSKGGPVIDKFVIESLDKTVETTPVTGVALDASELTLNDDQKNALLCVTILPENASNKNVRFVSSNPQVAEVTEDGLVISRQNGQTVITVTTEDGSKTAVCNVRVQRCDLAAATLETMLFNAKKILDAGQGSYGKEAWDYFSRKYEAAAAEKDSADWNRLKILTEELQAALDGLQKNQTVKALSAPTGVKAVSTISGVSVTFSPVANAASYDIYRKSGSASTKIASVKTVSYLDEKAPGGTKSDYTVVAVSGQKDYTDSAASTAASVTLPKAVSKLKVKAVSGGAQITFKKVKGAKKYIILRATKKSGPYKKIKVLKAKQTSFVDKKAKKGKNFYKVVTQKGGAYSPASKTAKAKVKK